MNSAWSDFFQQKKKHEKENEEKLKRSLVGVSSATMTKRVFRMLAAMHPTWIRHIQYTSPKDVRFLTYKYVWYLWSGAYRKFDRNHQAQGAKISFVGFGPSAWIFKDLRHLQNLGLKTYVLGGILQSLLTLVFKKVFTKISLTFQYK